MPLDIVNNTLPPRFAKTWEKLPKARWTAFGTWIRAKFGKNVPVDIDDKDIVRYMDSNPNKFNLSPTSFVDMFRAMPDLQESLGSIKDKDLQLLEIELERISDEERSTYQHGEVSFTTAGESLGITDAGAKKIADRAQDAVSRFYSGKNPNEINAEEFDTLFGENGVYERTVQKAVEIYCRILFASKGDADLVFDELRTVGALAENDLDDLTMQEYIAVQHLADLANEGKIEQVALFLKRDLDKPLNDSNIVKSFQNLVARLTRRRLDKTDVEAGKKRPRGRPRKTEETAPKPI